MKNSIIAFCLLVTMHYSCAMELAPLYQQRPDFIADKFLAHMPNWPLEDSYRIFEKLNNEVKLKISEKIYEKKSTLLLFILFPKDILTATIEALVPRYELKPKVVAQDTQYTHYVNGYPARKPFVLHPAAKPHLPEQKELISTNNAFQEIFKKKPHEAFSLFHEYANQKQITIRDCIQGPSQVKGSCGANSDWDFDDEVLTRSYGLSFGEYAQTTGAQRNLLLDKIPKGHNEGKWHGKIDQRYKMTQADIDLLMPIKDLILNNELLRHLEIGIDCPATTTYDSAKDLLLFALPLSAAIGFVPYAIHNNIDGKIQTVIGGAASYGCGFIIGDYIFPAFDFFNSDAQKLRKWFGSKNRTPFEKRWSFAALGLFHFLSHALGQKLISWQKLPYQVLGYTVHGLRVLSTAFNIKNMQSYFRRTFFLGLLAEIFNLRKHEHILERRNKDDKSYTLGDLLSAQPPRQQG